MERVEDYVQVLKYLPGTTLIRKALCKKCIQVILDLPDDPTESELTGEASRFHLHMELNHDIDIRLLKCADPDCVEHRESR